MTFVLSSPFLLAGVAALAMQWWLSGRAGAAVPWTLVVAAAVAVLSALGDMARARHLRGDRTTVAAIAGVAACAWLVWGGGMDILRFRLVASVGAETVELPGIGIVLGVMLLTALAGALLFGADRLAPGASAVAPALARRATMLAAGLGVIAVGLIAKAALEGRDLAAFANLGGGLLGATVLLAAGSAAALVDRLPGDGAAVEARASWLVQLASTLAMAALLATGISAWLEQASYLAGSTHALVVVALAGFAARQPTGLRMLRALLFAGLLVAVVAAGAPS
jgi:hypothetical protein